MDEQGGRATLRRHVTITGVAPTSRPPLACWSSSLALHRHPRRDATLLGTAHRALTQWWSV